MQKTPAGIEKVLLVAERDPEFLAALLADRQRAVGRGAFALSPVERTVLRSIPDVRLK